MFAWTPQTTDEAVSMWKRGLSAGEIAKALGISRNSVIGKLHRLGHKRGYVPPSDGMNHVERRKVRRAAARALKPPKPPKAKPMPKLAVVEIAPLLIDIMDLQTRHCRWPYGEGEILYCGHDKASGAYCLRHAKLAYEPERSERSRKRAKGLVRLVEHRQAERDLWLPGEAA